MTTDAPPPFPPQPPRSGPEARSGVPPLLNWLGGTAVLGVIALTLFVVSVSRSGGGSSTVCQTSGSTLGECLLATFEYAEQTKLFLVLSVAIGLGAATCLVMAVVVSIADRRR